MPPLSVRQRIERLSITHDAIEVMIDGKRATVKRVDNMSYKVNGQLVTVTDTKDKTASTRVSWAIDLVIANITGDDAAAQETRAKLKYFSTRDECPECGAIKGKKAKTCSACCPSRGKPRK